MLSSAMSNSINPQASDLTTYDVIVIGAGCNGAGIARDAAMRGLRVLLLDKSDICGETSSWSSRLIHGGLRYLEHGQLRLVRESLRERKCLLKTAGHLVKPLPMLIPIYDRLGRPKWKIRLGMIAYDLLSIGKSLDPHRMLSTKQVLQRAKGINPQQLRGAALYYDAQVQYPERLVLENAIDAQKHGANIHTYCCVEQLILENNSVVGVTYRDTLAGSTHTAHAAVTVNATGPWVDAILGKLKPSTKQLLEPTRGSHLIVKPFPDAPRDAVYTEAADGRPVFILPWIGQYLIGTTDARFCGDPSNVRTESAEIDYLLKVVNRLFPSAAVDRNSVLYTYTGIRPLASTSHRSTAAMTRRHFIHDHAPSAKGLLSVIGGKLTTYRSLAEQVVDRIFQLQSRRAPKCPTAQTLLPGGCEDIDAFRQAFNNNHSLPERSNEHLLRVYGKRAANVLTLVDETPSLGQPFCPHSGAIAAEIVFAFQDEMARTLADVLLRRTMVGLGPSLGLDVLEAAATIAQQHLGWDPKRTQREIAIYRQQTKRFVVLPESDKDQ